MSKQIIANNQTSTSIAPFCFQQIIMCFNLVGQICTISKSGVVLESDQKKRSCVRTTINKRLLNCKSQDNEHYRLVMYFGQVSLYMWL